MNKYYRHRHVDIIVERLNKTCFKVIIYNNVYYNQRSFEDRNFDNNYEPITENEYQNYLLKIL